MNPPNRSITGEMLCRLRMVKRFPQKHIAAKLQMTQQVYSKIERNDIVRPSILTSVLEAMHSNMDELAIANFLK